MPAERLRAGIDRLGGRYRLRIADDITRATGFLAGADARRADELNGLLRDPDVRAIFLARGGYGIMRILDRLDADALRRDPKPIVGFSDATALLFWALAAGVRSIHGPVVAQLGDLPPGDCEWLIDRLEGRPVTGPVGVDLVPCGAPRTGLVEGTLCGGNLCLLTHLLGTPYAPRLDGAVALLEEVGERPYAIDRYLTHLGLAGFWTGVRAAVIGDLVRCEEKVLSPDPDATAVVDERLAAFGVAGVRGAPIGHGGRNLAVPFGGRVAVDFDAGRFEIVDRCTH